jgi:hypothetical protein
MKKYKYLIYISIASTLLFSCGTVKEAFDPNKNSGDEFLVEKKSPLTMPPNFDELPVPQNNEKDDQGQKKDLELLITNIDKSKKQSTEEEIFDSDFEKLILDKVKNK